MADKMLGKVVAGAALGGASLLVFTPGMAYAGGHDDGKVITKPHVVKAGDTVELLEICPEPQEHAYVWSKVTGKVDLHPARDGEHGDWADGGEHGNRSDGGDWGEDADQGPDGKDAHGPDEHGKGPEEGKDEAGKGPEEGKDEQGKGEQGKPGTPQPPADAPRPGGKGGGLVADPEDQAPDWAGHEEHGQDAEPGWDASDWAGDESRGDGKDGHGKEAEHGGPGKEAEHGKEAKDAEHGKDGKEAEHGKEDKDAEHGKDAKEAEHGKEGEEAAAGKDAEYGDEHGKDGKDEHGGEWQGGDGYGRDEAGWEHGEDFVYYGEAHVSEHVRPGRYELSGSCGEGELVVLPRGGVDGGDGGMSTTGVDRGLATGGAGMIGAAALGGLVLLRRRRAGDLA
ncbi:hypothetical protein [Micromonospora sp. NBS 11-29]|uniref:hypothetical protein n=1 Tax=Micromonospora sp. NBS 11-29 TaxID=1960879 RepID=UPI000B76F70C|nr:hypothetical protein [Micromonospora sp. NBS 11-29]